MEIKSNFTKKVKAACEKKESLFDKSLIKYIFRSMLAGPI